MAGGTLKFRYLPFKIYSALLVTSHCVLHRKDLSMAGGMHMVAARLDCKRAIVGTKLATSGCMDQLRKHYSHLVGVSFLARKAAWALDWGL